MKVAGYWLLIIGVVIALASLLMPVTAPVDVPATSIYDLPQRSNILNIGLLQNQMMVFVAGLALAIVGAVFAAAGHVGGRGGSQAAAPEVSAVPQDGALPDRPQSIEDMRQALSANRRALTPEEQAEASARDRREMTFVVAGAGIFLLIIIIAMVIAGSVAGKQVDNAVVNNAVVGEAMNDTMTAPDLGEATNGLEPTSGAAKPKPAATDLPMDGDTGDEDQPDMPPAASPTPADSAVEAYRVPPTQGEATLPKPAPTGGE